MLELLVGGPKIHDKSTCALIMPNPEQTPKDLTQDGLQNPSRAHLNPS